MQRRVLCVFVPGIKGTELWCDQCGKRAWPPAFIDNLVEVAIRSARKDNSFHMEKLMNADEYECIRHHAKTPVAVIGSVKALYGLYTREIYDPFLKRLRRVISDVQSQMQVSARLMTFPYDWTSSNVKSANKLYHTLLNLVNAYDDILLVAHSMGGLICRYMLEYVLKKDRLTTIEELKLRETLAGKIVLFYGVGVPHYGCIKSLHQLVNPREEILASVCRDLPSLYEMIPFSNLNVKHSQWQRYRSNLFLHQEDDRDDIMIDPDFWRLNSDSQTDSQTSHQHTSEIVNELMNKYPVLHDNENKLRSGLAFHQTLNTNLKPNSCVYVLVNATGVNSPSEIDSRGELVNECFRGDGVVCSAIPLKRSKKQKLKSLFRSAKTQRLQRITNKVQLPKDHVYTNSVHVTMLNAVDLVSPIKGVIAERFRHSSDWNVESFVFDHIRPSRSRILQCFMKRKTSRMAVNLPANLSSRVTKMGVYNIVIIDNPNTDRCLIALEKTTSTPTENIDSNISLSLKKEAATTRCHRSQRVLDSPDLLSIGISTRGYGTAWNELGIILSGHYKLVSPNQ